MKGLKSRVVILAIAMTLIMATMACTTSTMIGRGPEVTATATKTPKPTFTATLTPTDTPIPTNTPEPTDTPTPVTPTNTPLVLTATDTPLPTDTPAPTATNVPPTKTPKPTAKPKPKATAVPTKKPTPKPTPMPQFAWRGTVAQALPNCGWTGVLGLTLASNGGVAGDIWVHFWADGWTGAWSKSDWTVNRGYPGEADDKNWDGTLGNNYARAGTWYVCVVPGEGSANCISNTMTVVTVSEPCAPESNGVQVVRIIFQKN